MKASHLSYMVLLLMTTACCRRCDEVVCETYFHRYGVPLEDQEDWEARGQHGQVVAVLKDGVSVCRSYEAGVLHGETTYTFPHRDTIQKREMYDQGALVKEVWNYSNGAPYKQVEHNSATNQSHLIWYESGVPQCREEYENGLLTHGEYFNPNNVSEAVVTNQNGKRVRRDRYGELESLDEIQNGQLVLRTTYHPNGAPASITPYVNGVAEGQRCTYLPAGEPQTIEQWSKGKQHGMTTVFEDGEKRSVLPYVQGMVHGTEYRYRDGDTVVEEVTWDRGHRHGPSYTYVGNTKQTNWYFQDRQVNKQTYDALCNQ